MDVTLNLTTVKYWPYRKPGDTPLYINLESNHPPNIKKQLPRMISMRLSQNSCNPDEFSKAIPEYQEALEKSEYRKKLTYIKKIKNQPLNLEQEKSLGSTLLSMKKQAPM